MAIKPRPYNGLQDFIVMTSILSVGRKTSEHPYFVHTGDLSWWLFFDDHEDDYWQDHICIWEKNGRPFGWTLMDPEWQSFDVNLLPDMQGTHEETYVLDWTIGKISEVVQGRGGQKIQTAWVSESDLDRINQLEDRGFTRDESFMYYLEHPLNNHIPELMLPMDFVVRPVKDEAEKELRAAVGYNASGMTRGFDEFMPRYEKFIDSPVYNPDFDLVTETPDGQFASFCVIWPDPVNKVGLLEPIGIHPSFNNQGLGRAVVTAGLNRLKGWGMDRAMICVDHDNPTALQFHLGLGFIVKQKLYTFEKCI